MEQTCQERPIYFSSNLELVEHSFLLLECVRIYLAYDHDLGQSSKYTGYPIENFLVSLEVKGFLKNLWNSEVSRVSIGSEELNIVFFTYYEV